jgi:hypothetical protein
MQWKFFPPGLLLALVLSAGSESRAADFTWSGGGADNNWNTLGNWLGGVAPPNDGSAAIVFSGAVRPTPNVNANWDILSLSFAADAGAFTVGGNPLTIEGGGITNSSTTGQTINNSITMGAAQTWSANTGPLTFGGAAVGTAGFPLSLSGEKGSILSAAVTSTGTIHVTSGSKATFGGALTNSGSLVIDSASVAVSQPYAAAGSITNNGGFILFGSNYTGTVGIAGNGSAFFSGVLSTGTGTTTNLTFGGSVTIFNKLLERLAGAAPNQYDSITTSGILSLSGATLQVTLAGGFTPAAGSSFNLLHAVRSGAFSTISLPALGPGMAWSTLKLYSDGSISVVDANLIPGDLDHNAAVDVADVLTMETALRDLSGYENIRGLTDDSQLGQVADLNSDRKVDNRDLQALLNFEARLAGTGTASIAPVPEPPAVLLIAVGAIAIVACADRERSRSLQRFLVSHCSRMYSKLQCQ